MIFRCRVGTSAPGLSSLAIVGFGVSTVLRDTGLVPGAAAYLFLAGVIIVDVILLYRFFAAHGSRFDLARTS